MTGYEIYQAVSNAALGILFLCVSLANAQVLATLIRRDSHSRLAMAMVVKYSSWIVAGVVLFVLQVYSAIFNITKETGFFTLEVRNLLRNVATLALLVVVIALFSMNRELRKAEDGEWEDDV